MKIINIEENISMSKCNKITDIALDRIVRVFISSTFRDMMKERDYLIKNVFTELKKRCRSINVEFIEIDLRWGITEEESKQGKVIELCMKEIDKCKPYFIGILGGRYGFIPKVQDVKDYLMQNSIYFHLEDIINQNISITELEIQYGVIKNKYIKSNAYFYLKNELATPAEYKEPIDSIEYSKLINLKNKLLNQTDYPVKSFSDVDELGKLILEDLWTSISERFPQESIPDELTKQWIEHTSFAKSRLGLYIGGDKYIAEINKLIDDENKPIVISGESGLGKSALISNWIYQYQKKYPDTYILYHFIGGASDSTDYVQIMLRIMKELKRRVYIESEIPTDQDNIISEFPNFLAQSGTYGNWILVIDALNQLDNENNSLLLNWLPDKFPKFVKTILSVTDNNPIENILKERNYSFVNINPLSKVNAKNIVVDYLKSFGKTLNEDNINLISENYELNKPLLLRTFLDEIRIFGEHEKLKEKIEYYTSNKDPNDFFVKIIDRIEADTNISYPNLLKIILCLISCSRKGISENEILDILNIPLLHWVTIKNYIETYLINRKGLINLSHDNFKKAVIRKYLNDGNYKNDICLKLINYFYKNLLSERSIDELPFLLTNLEKYEDLKVYLSNLKVFKYLYEKDKYELIKYWKCLEDKYDIKEVIKESVIEFSDNDETRDSDLSDYYFTISVFLINFGLLSDSLHYQNLNLNAIKTKYGINSNEYSVALNSLSAIYSKMGEYDKAIKAISESSNIIKSLNGKNNILYALSLHLLGFYYYNKSEFENTESCYLEALEIYKNFNYEKNINYSILVGNIGSYYQKIGDYAKAEQYLLESKRLKKIILGEKNPIYASSLGNIGFLYFYKSEYQKAEDLYLKAIDLYKETSSERNPDYITALINVANLYAKVGSNEKAEYYYTESLNVQKNTLGNMHPSYAISLNNLGAFYYNINKLQEAEELYEQAMNIFLKSFNKKHHEYINTLGNLALVYMKRNKNVEAEAILKESIELMKQKYGTDHPEYARSIYSLSMLYFSIEVYEKAETLFLEALDVYRKTLGNNHVDYITVLLNYANLCRKIGNDDKAESLYLESLKLQKNIYGSINANLAVNMNNLGAFYFEKGDYDKTKPYYLEALEMNQKLFGEHSNESINTMINIFYLYYKIKDFKNIKLYYDKIIELRKNLPQDIQNFFKIRFRKLDELYKPIKYSIKIGLFLDKFSNKK